MSMGSNYKNTEEENRFRATSKLQAINAAIEDFDHYDEAHHALEIQFGCASSLAKMLCHALKDILAAGSSTTESSTNKKNNAQESSSSSSCTTICNQWNVITGALMCLEMVYRCSEDVMQRSLDEIGPMLLPTMLTVMREAVENKHDNSNNPFQNNNNNNNSEDPYEMELRRQLSQSKQVAVASIVEILGYFTQYLDDNATSLLQPLDMYLPILSLVLEHITSKICVSSAMQQQHNKEGNGNNNEEEMALGIIRMLNVYPDKRSVIRCVGLLNGVLSSAACNADGKTTATNNDTQEAVIAFIENMLEDEDNRMIMATHEMLLDFLVRMLNFNFHFSLNSNSIEESSSQVQQGPMNTDRSTPPSSKCNGWTRCTAINAVYLLTTPIGNAKRIMAHRNGEIVTALAHLISDDSRFPAVDASPDVKDDDTSSVVSSSSTSTITTMMSHYSQHQQQLYVHTAACALCHLLSNSHGHSSKAMERLKTSMCILQANKSYSTFLVQLGTLCMTHPDLERAEAASFLFLPSPVISYPTFRAIVLGGDHNHVQHLAAPSLDIMMSVIMLRCGHAESVMQMARDDRMVDFLAAQTKSRHSSEHVRTNAYHALCKVQNVSPSSDHNAVAAAVVPLEDAYLGGLTMPPPGGETDSRGRGHRSGLSMELCAS